MSKTLKTMHKDRKTPSGILCSIPQECTHALAPNPMNVEGSRHILLFVKRRDVLHHKTAAQWQDCSLAGAPKKGMPIRSQPGDTYQGFTSLFGPTMDQSQTTNLQFRAIHCPVRQCFYQYAMLGWVMLLLKTEKPRV